MSATSATLWSPLPKVVVSIVARRNHVGVLYEDKSEWMNMKPSEYYKGQRLSLKSQPCTVRYVGVVASKPGTWLGVEWDDASRGKHNGTHEGVKYFECRSKSPSAGSFLRQTQQWDPHRTFLQALREKYMPEFHESDAKFVYFNGKQAEEIGFEKFHQRQAKLQGIRVLVLDRMQIQHRSRGLDDDKSITEICADITDLDLSGNLFETFDEIVQLCRQLPKLRVLTLDNNRFDLNCDRPRIMLPSIQTLSLSHTLLDEAEVNSLISNTPERIFPSLESLNIAGNEYCGPLKLLLPLSISSVDLSDNDLTMLSDLVDWDLNSPLLNTLSLKRNRISKVTSDTSKATNWSLPVMELDLSYNAISSFEFFNDVTSTTFPELKHLRVAGNPVYKSLVSAEGKQLATEDGYMLTIARLPQLESLNYSKITEKERLNAETYYLSQIATEIARAANSDETRILAKHPRYHALCEEYGEPSIRREVQQNEIDPNSLAARLIPVTFALASDLLPESNEYSWTEEVPKSFNIYSVLGTVGKRLGRVPLELRLILETNEKDPIGKNGAYSGPEWWDSSDDEADNAQQEWVTREVELVAGTRALGTFVEGDKATIRVELRCECAAYLREQSLC